MKTCQRSIDFIGGIDPKELLEKNKTDILNPFAIISPHAGYIFSGEVASTIFNTIDPDKEYDNVFILSTSHTSNFHGGKLFKNIYETPFGNMEINDYICNDLDKDCKYLEFLDSYIEHYIQGDHTIEVVLPFIFKKLKPGYKIIPIMIGDSDIEHIKEISDCLKPYLTDDNLFIISSDFSHYTDAYNAISIDKKTKDLILQNDAKKFLAEIFNYYSIPNLVTRMCGWSAYLTLLYMIENDPTIDIKDVIYRNSSDTQYGEKDSVVGYFGVSFCKK